MPIDPGSGSGYLDNTIKDPCKSQTLVNQLKPQCLSAELLSYLTSLHQPHDVKCQKLNEVYDCVLSEIQEVSGFACEDTMTAIELDKSWILNIFNITVDLCNFHDNVSTTSSSTSLTTDITHVTPTMPANHTTRISQISPNEPMESTIIGGVVGGVVLLTILLSISLLLIRRRYIKESRKKQRMFEGQQQFRMYQDLMIQRVHSVTQPASVYQGFDQVMVQHRYSYANNDKTVKCKPSENHDYENVKNKLGHETPDAEENVYVEIHDGIYDCLQGYVVRREDVEQEYLEPISCSGSKGDKEKTSKSTGSTNLAFISDF